MIQNEPTMQEAPSKQKQNTLKVIYKDRYITITPICIIIYKYYVPLMTSKTVIFSDLEKITVQDAYNINNRWGTNARCLNNWFHYDPDRKGKLKFLCFHIKGSRVRPSITPQNFDTVVEILKKIFANIEWKSVYDQSDVGKETQIAQKQAQEMMKQQKQQENQYQQKKETQQDMREIQGKEQMQIKQEISQVLILRRESKSNRNKVIEIEDLQ